MSAARRPVRVRQRRGVRLPDGAKSVARSSRWGNLYKIPPYSREDSLRLYRVHAEGELARNPAWLEPLRGWDLACYCELGEVCHADILLELLAVTPPSAAAQRRTVEDR